MSAYSKYIINHSNLYIVKFTKNKNLPCIVFMHGGPGLNCGVLEYLIEHENIFDTLEYDIVLYDQRNCGRSKFSNKSVLHNDNILDLEEICRILIENQKYNIAALAGHSYGAKLLFDYLQYQKKVVPSIFISTASSILIPRINNLLLDFAYLKEFDQKQYQILLGNLDEFSYEKLWQLTENLANVFQQNKDRPYFYWANLEWKEKVKSIQDKIKLPMNKKIFMSIRKDLYSNPNKFSVDVKTITKSPYILINGFHDFIMNGASELNNSTPFSHLFYKSAHYPHIEENKKFCKVVNDFLKKN